MTTVAGKAVLVTGASRGIGQALVEEVLRRGAQRVYAAARQPLQYPDARVTPLMLDVTSPPQVSAAARAVGSLDILINNAGLGLGGDLSDRAAIEAHLAVNLYGTYDVTQAFLPLLTQSRGTVVNVSSLAALAAVPVMAPYSISKAAAFSMTQALRALLAARGVRVVAALPGPVDTDMSAGLAIPKAPAQSVARGILDGLEGDEEEIFPDDIARSLFGGWAGGAVKAFEQQNATLIAALPAASAA